MNLKEWAQLLNGREYTEEVTSEESKQMAADGIIAAYGASDDLLEFSGALNDECGAWEGTDVRLHKSSEGEIELLSEGELDAVSDNVLKRMKTQIDRMLIIKAIWCPKELKTSWLIETSIPHEKFDIFEEGELYCRGIVFHVDNVPTF